MLFPQLNTQHACVCIIGSDSLGRVFKRQPSTALREEGGGGACVLCNISQQPYVALDGLSIGDAKHG